MMLGDYRSLTLNVVNRLTSVTRLFPNSFNDKFCDQMMVRNFGVVLVWALSFNQNLMTGRLVDKSEAISCIFFIFLFLSQQHLRKWMEVVVITHKGGQRSDGSVSKHISDLHVQHRKFNTNGNDMHVFFTFVCF